MYCTPAFPQLGCATLLPPPSSDRNSIPASDDAADGANRTSRTEVANDALRCLRMRTLLREDWTGRMTSALYCDVSVCRDPCVACLGAPDASGGSRESAGVSMARR